MDFNHRQLSLALGAQWTFAFCKLLILKEWSGRMDLNHRPPGPEPGALARLRYAPTATLECFIANQAGLPDYHSSSLPSYSGHFPNNLSPHFEPKTRSRFSGPSAMVWLFQKTGPHKKEPPGSNRLPAAFRCRAGFLAWLSRTAFHQKETR